MASLGNKTLKHRGPRHFGGSLITPPPSDYLAQFYDTRRGYGEKADAGYGTGVQQIVVNDSTDDLGSGLRVTLKGALLVTGKTHITFAPGVGDILIASHGAYICTSNTLLDGYGWGGCVYGSIYNANCDNFIAMFITATQPFSYNTNPSGGCFTASNCPRAYFYHCTAWDTGDVIFASGAYQLTPGHLTDQPSPYLYTVDSCRFGPNPGEYAMLATMPSVPSTAGFTDRGTWTSSTAYPQNSTILNGGYRFYAALDIPASTTFNPYDGWWSPGWLNGVDNDARNGKCMNCAFDHQWIYGSGRFITVKFTDSTHFTVTTGTLSSTDGRTMVLGAGITKGTDGEGSSFTFLTTTTGVLSGGATYTGTLNIAITDAQVYKPSSVPHPDDFVTFDHASFGTMINNVMQGCHIRNGKARSENVDVIMNLITKYGTPFGLGGAAAGGISYGGGAACDDNATMNIEGNVFIPYNVGEQTPGFQNAVADAHGVPHIICDSSISNNTAISAEGTANKTGNARIALNYVVGQTQEAAKFNTGFTRTYDTPITVNDASAASYAAATVAKALVTKLEYNSTTRAGNPWSTTQPPSWTDTHTGSEFTS